MEPKLFPAKVLLFGEYTVLLGSKALAIPFPHFSGELAFSNDRLVLPEQDRESSIQSLKSFYEYVHISIQNTELAGYLNMEAFEKDVRNGLFFNSSIPIGYGLGSSGALTAAVYQRYIAPPLRIPVNLTSARKNLGYLESFFHHSSSGIDPLVSICKYPLIFYNERIEKFIIPNWHRKFTVFLLDTKIKRSTENLVGDFIKTAANENQSKRFETLAVACDDCIRAFQEGNNDLLFQHVQHLSEIQFNLFRDYIPEPFLPVWEKGLNTGNYFLKLCGAGGGGYLLGFSEKDELIRKNNESTGNVEGFETLIVNS